MNSKLTKHLKLTCFLAGVLALSANTANFNLTFSPKNLATRTIFTDNRHKTELIDYLQNNIINKNISEKDLNDLKVFDLTNIEKLLKQNNWDFEKDNYLDFDWYQGLNLTLGFKQSTKEIKIIQHSGKDAGKDYDFAGIYSQQIADFSTDKKILTFIEETNKEQLIKQTFIQITKKSKTQVEAIKKIIGFINIVPPGNEYAKKTIKTAATVIADAKMLPSLVDLLKSNETEEGLKYYTAGLLGAMDNDASLDAIVDIMNDDKVDTTTQSIMPSLLGKSTNPKALDILIKNLSTKNTYVLEESINTLGTLRDKKAVAPLMAVFKQSKQHYILVACVKSLGKIGDKKAIPTLAKAYRHPKFDMKSVAMEALGRVNDKKSLNILYKLMMKKNKNMTMQMDAAISISEANSEQAADMLGKALDNKKTRLKVRSAIIESLSYITNEKAFEYILKELNRTEDEKIQKQCIKILGKRKNPKAIKSLAALMDKITIFSENYEHIVTALGEIGNKDAAPSLMKALKTLNISFETRLNAIKALGEIGDKAAVNLLIENLHTHDEKIRNAAVVALGTIQDESAKDALILASRSEESPNIRKAIAQALMSIGKETLLLNEKVFFDWHNFGISSKTLMKSYLCQENENKENFISTVKTLFGNEAAGRLNISWNDTERLMDEEVYFDLKTDNHKTIKQGIKTVYGYLEEMKFKTDIKLGEEHEIIEESDIPRKYYELFPRGNDKNEIYTYPTHPLYQKVFTEHLPAEKVGIHRSIEQKTDKMDTILINTICQLYSRGMIHLDLFIGTDINPQGNNLWGIRYDNQVKNKFGKDIRLLQTTDWKNHMSGTLMWYLMNYADKFPHKWAALRTLLLNKLTAYDIDMYNYTYKGKNKLVPTHKKNNEGEIFYLPEYQYNLTKIPDGEENSVMRLIVNDNQVVDALTGMVLEVTEELLEGRKDLKRLMAFEALTEIYKVVSVGNIPDAFAKYREYNAINMALEKTADVFTDHQDAAIADSDKEIANHIAVSA